MAAAEEGSAFFGGCQGDEGFGHEVVVVDVALFYVPSWWLGGKGRGEGLKG